MIAAMNDSEAADWAIRRENGPLSPGDQRAFEAWLAGDERRAGALLRADAALVYLDRGRALAGLAQAEDSPEPEAEEPAWMSRRMLVGGGMAALVAIGAGIAGLVKLPRSDVIATGVGEIKRTPLADGSVATVNTASRLTVAMTGDVRNVSLDDGEAWFEVAHDQARPFVVQAGDVSVRAVGTAFSVRRTETGVDILVTEGVVEAWRADQPDKATRIEQGERGFIAEEARLADSIPGEVVAVQSSTEIDRSLAWRNGDLALNGETLDYAVAEINRYNRRKLIVDNVELGRAPIVGYFKVNEPENFARSVAVLFDASVHVTDNAIRLDTKKE
ncbi:MAG: FecR domain-containing protein [Pseudomonadota bacterium]